jgi:predicted transport protein
VPDSAPARNCLNDGVGYGITLMVHADGQRWRRLLLAEHCAVVRLSPWRCGSVVTRLRNFACVEVHPRDHCLLVYAKVDPATVALADGFTRDVRSIGHFGTGGLEIRIRDQAGLERANDLLLHSYQAS